MRTRAGSRPVACSMVLLGYLLVAPPVLLFGPLAGLLLLGTARHFPGVALAHRDAGWSAMWLDQARRARGPVYSRRARFC